MQNPTTCSRVGVRHVTTRRSHLLDLAGKWSVCVHVPSRWCEVFLSNVCESVTAPWACVSSVSVSLYLRDRFRLKNKRISVRASKYTSIMFGRTEFKLLLSSACVDQITLLKHSNTTLNVSTVIHTSHCIPVVVYGYCFPNNICWLQEVTEWIGWSGSATRLGASGHTPTAWNLGQNISHWIEPLYRRSIAECGVK